MPLRMWGWQAKGPGGFAVGSSPAATRWMLQRLPLAAGASSENPCQATCSRLPTRAQRARRWDARLCANIYKHLERLAKPRQVAGSCPSTGKEAQRHGERVWLSGRGCRERRGRGCDSLGRPAPRDAAGTPEKHLKRKRNSSPDKKLGVASCTAGSIFIIQFPPFSGSDVLPAFPC